MMALLLVVAETEQKALGEKVAAEFKDEHYALSSSQWLIDAELTTGELSKKLELPKGNFGMAVVFKVDAYSGFHRQSLWEWLKLD